MGSRNAIGVCVGLENSESMLQAFQGKGKHRIAEEGGECLPMLSSNRTFLPSVI